jgi:two-component system, OmpR family, response regulator QseB
MTRVLVVEDQPTLRGALKTALDAAGMAADTAAGMAEAEACRRALAPARYAALLLDRGLPEGDGLAWLARLRREGEKLPCLVLTARDALHDRIDGLEAGADDYLAKPFAMAELVARMRALLRRQASWQPTAPALGDLLIDPDSAELRCGKSSVALACSELQLMLTLARAEGGLVKRVSLESAAWGLSEAVSPNALDVALHRLRRKLALVGSRVQIRNSKGIGYALVADT